MILKRNTKGFTLMEVLIVVIVLAVLAGLAVPMYSSSVEKSRKAEALATLAALRQSEIRFFAQNNTYTNNLAQLDFDSEVDVSVLGDGAFKVTWDPTERRVRVSTPDVQGLYAWWLGDDVSRVWRVASRYYLSDEEAILLYGAAVMRQARPSAGRGPYAAAGRKQHVVVEVWTQDDFELWFDGALLESKPNPYGFMPFVLYPNLREPKPDTFASALRMASAGGCHSTSKSPRP